MASKHFIELTEKLKEIHIKKNADYANDENPFQNFERAAELVSWFTDPIDRTFAAIIGIKLARLSELLVSGKIPNNESIDDTHLDLTAYCGLWASYKLASKNKVEKAGVPFRCFKCSMTYKDWDSLSNHLLSFHRVMLVTEVPMDKEIPF